MILGASLMAIAGLALTLWCLWICRTPLEDCPSCGKPASEIQEHGFFSCSCMNAWRPGEGQRSAKKKWRLRW